MSEVRNIVVISGTVYVSIPKVWANQMKLDEGSQVRVDLVTGEGKKHRDKLVLTVEKED